LAAASSSGGAEEEESDICYWVLQVSHDEHLITGSVDELWVVSDGRVTPFSGTFKDYKKMLL
jgi:hypothetical protein